MGKNALGQSVYDSMPPMVAKASRCIDEGQDISFEGTLETMWHTSILIKVKPCDTTAPGNNCLPRAERAERLRNIRFFVTFTTQTFMRNNYQIKGESAI
jgi:hypothetical protein